MLILAHNFQSYSAPPSAEFRKCWNGALRFEI
jgi:hypothetical protein